VFVVLARQPIKGEGFLDVFLGPFGEPGIAWRPFLQPRSEVAFGLRKRTAIVDPTELLKE
jgi:hypothetical protein